MAPKLPDKILIIAHPGHELRLFHWMEIYRPTVFVLTDGSGSVSDSRLEYTKRILEKVDAMAGSVFGQLSDREWYSSIISRKSHFLLDVAEQIFRATAHDPPSLIVTDPIEGYNPMHDLCAGVGGAVQSLLNQKGGLARLGNYDLTRPLTGEDYIERLSLDEQAILRKQQAITAYEAIDGEASKVLSQTPNALSEETVYSANPITSQLSALVKPPEYETTGQERVISGRYTNAISYSEHVKPIFNDLIELVRADN